MLVSRRYACLVEATSTGAIWNLPPELLSSSAANTLGESNLGIQHQSIVPSVAARAADDMSPIRP